MVEKNISHEKYIQKGLLILHSVEFMQSLYLLQNSKTKRILGLEEFKLVRVIKFTYIFF